MPRYFVHISYKGTRYHGWQMQPNAETVQEKLNKALTILFRVSIETTGCGRTDTGVHATQFFAHFDIPFSLNDTSHSTLHLNAILPEDIRVYAIIEVEATAHARFDATKRSYSYYISRIPDAFYYDFAWLNTRNMDIDIMNRMSSMCLQHEDFSCFNKSGGQQQTNNCSIYECYWVEEENILRFNVSANRFLRGMVRAMVGTMLEGGLHKLDEEDFRNILLNKDRKQAGQAVPPKGLFLEEVVYPYIRSTRRSLFNI